MISQMKSSLIDYTLHLADNTLILAQRNAEWCGHGPVLERRGRVFGGDAGGIDRRHAEGSVRSLRTRVGPALPGSAVGRDWREREVEEEVVDSNTGCAGSVAVQILNEIPRMSIEGGSSCLRGPRGRT